MGRMDTKTLSAEAIREMPAGPEMDALVAEWVMGCTAVVQREWSWKNTGGDSDSASGVNFWCQCPAFPSHNVHDAQRIKPYSKEMGAAWEVVEKMRTDGWYMDIEVEPGEPACVMAFRGRDGYGPIHAFGVGAETAPLAICRSVLLAVHGQHLPTARSSSTSTTPLPS